VAPGLAAIQEAYSDVQIGSYPFFEKGALGTYVVLRCTDEERLEAALRQVWELTAREGFRASAGEERA
jgi:hypothetical protein